jgi:hypothetical protein
VDGQFHALAIILLSWERPGIHFTGGCLGPRVGLDRCRNSPPHHGIWSMDPPAFSCLLYWLSSAGPLLIWSFGGNEATSHPPKHLHVLYRPGALIDYSACESALVCWCLTQGIAVVALHWDMIDLLRDQGHLSCQIPYTRVRLRGFHFCSSSGRCSVWEQGRQCCCWLSRVGATTMVVSYRW